MKIESIAARWAHVPIPKARQHKSDLGVADHFDATIVRIETACGLVGWGEAKASVGSMGNNAALAALINRDLGPRLIGEDPRDPQASVGDRLQRRPRPLRARARPGLSGTGPPRR